MVLFGFCSSRERPAVALVVGWVLAGALRVVSSEPLPGTAAMDWPEADLSERLMDGAHRFVERQIAEAARDRYRYWPDEGTSGAAREAALNENRARLKEILGVRDERLAPRMERFGDDTAPALVCETPELRVFQVRWEVLTGVEAEGLWVQPVRPATGYVVAVPDADQLPEQLLGLAPGVPAEQQWARRLAESGVEVVIPTLVSREPVETEDPAIRASGQTEREWIHRQSFHMGRHLIGFEVQKVLGAVDWFEARHGADVPVGVAGYAEGGLIAFYGAAVDPRIDAVWVSGYFDARERVWAEPIYRNVWSLLKRFGDAEVAALILPRVLVIEHAPVPTLTGHKGDWSTPSGASVRREFARIEAARDGPQPVLISGPGDVSVGPGSSEAMAVFARALGVEGLASVSGDHLMDRRKDLDAASRRRRVVTNLERHVQDLVRGADQVREAAFLYRVMPELSAWKWTREKALPVHDASRFIAAAEAYRERLYRDGLGRFEEAPLPLNARTRWFRETEHWVAYDVVLDVWPEVFAWGLLVLPKDLKPGERRPVVVCQHGRGGLPEVTLDPEDPGYNQVAGRLAELGFITFAPHNLYRGEDRYRWLSRKANAVQASLFSFILAQHEAILRWLGSLPYVDAGRIGFYGLSYGGETAVRVPPLLKGYALSICSGDFNQWTRKVASTDQPFSFMRTIEWEMPYWNLGHTFDYAEMAYLMIPRPFMVERGHLDSVGRDPWVAHEYAKVRWLYAQLGLADRTAIEFFQGGHSLNCEGTFEFLRKHLDWPPR